MATHPSSGARKCCSSSPSSSPAPVSPGGEVDRLTPPPGPRLLHCESPCSKGIPELVIVQDITDLPVGGGEQEGVLVEGGGKGCPPGDAPCPPAREAAGGVAGPALPHRPALPLGSPGVSSTTGQHPRLAGGADVQPDTAREERRGEGEGRGEDNVTASPPHDCPAPSPLGKATVLCEVPGGDMQGPEWSDLVCWQCGKECQVPQWAGTSDGQAGSLCHGVVGEAHAVHCPGEVVGSLQVLVGEALWQYPVLGHAEEGHHHAGEEWALVLSGRGWRVAINSCGGGGGELVTMSSDNMAGGAAPSPATLRPEPPSFSGRCSSIYGFKISGADSSKVRNLLPMFVSSRNTSREIPGGVTFRVKGDASWQTHRPKRNSDKCDIRMYRGEEGGAEDKDESGFIKLCGVNLGSGPASPNPYPLFRCNTLPRRLPSYRLSPLPAWPQASQTSLDSEIASSVPSSRRQSLIEAEEGLAAAHVQPGGDAGGGRGSGASLPRPPPSCESSSNAASPPWGPSTPPPPWGSTGSAPPDTTRCYVNSIPRPYRGSASSSTSTSPVPPAVPQLHRPRDFLPNTAEHSEPSQEDVALPLHQEDLDPCFPYELQPPAPLLTTRRAAAQRGAAGHAGITVPSDETASAQDAEVRVQLTSTNSATFATDPTVTSGASLASGTSAEGVVVAPSQLVTWPPRGANAQGGARRESGPPVATPSTPFQGHRREPVKSMEVEAEAMTQAPGAAFRPTTVTKECQPVPREATLLGGAKQLSCDAQEVTRPNPQREATPDPTLLPGEKEEEITPPASKEATPEPCLFSPIEEEEEEEEEEEATPPIEEEEATLPSSKEATPRPSLFISEVTPPASREATPQPCHPCVSEEDKSFASVDIMPHPSPPSPVLEEVTSLVSPCSFAPKETSPHPSSPPPPPLLSHSEEATPCHLDEDTLPPSILYHPEEIIPPPPQFKEVTPPPYCPSPSSTLPIEEKTSPSSPLPSSSLSEEATSSFLSEITLPLCSSSLPEETVPASHTNEAMLPPSPPPVASMQATPPSSPSITLKDVTPPSPLYYSVSEEVTLSSFPSVPSQKITSPTGKEATTCMTTTEVTSITIREITPPSIKTKEATPPPSPGGMGELVSPQKESVTMGSYGEAGEGVVTSPWVRSSEAASKTGISQRAAMLTRQADSPPLPRPTRFPLDIICGSKVSGELSPVAGTRHRLSSLGQVLPPPAHTSTRSKSASRVGSGGTDPNLGTPQRESDAGPKGGSGRELGQAEARTAPLPIVLPLDTTLKNKIRQTINSFAGQEATLSHAPVQNTFTSAPSTTQQDEMEAQCNKESETDQHTSYSPVSGNEAFAGEVSDSCGGGSPSDGGGAHRHCLLMGMKVFTDDAVGTGQAEDPGQTVTDVYSAFSGTLCEMAMPRNMDTAEDHNPSQTDDTSPVSSVDVESHKVISTSLPEEPLVVMSGQVSSYGSQSPSQPQELETKMLFIDEGATIIHGALKTPDSLVAATEYKDMKSLTSSLQEEREVQPVEPATCQFPKEVSSDEGQERDDSIEGTFAAVRVVVTEARESSPECEAEVSSLVREESVEEYEPALEVVSINPSRTSSHSSISVATVVTLGSHSHTPELPLPDEDAEEEFVDATDGTEGVREIPPNSKSNGFETSPVEAQSVSPVGASLKVECESPEDGSASSDGQATYADLPASVSASASSTGSDTWWTSTGGPVARRDLFPLDEDEDEAQWRAAHATVHLDTDEEPAGYEGDEDFATMDADMQRLEEKLKKFERELGGNDGSVIDECGSGKRDSITSPPRSSLGNESLRLIIPEVFPSRRSTQTKHLSLMTQLEVHQYGDSASESENESRVSSSSDSADFLFVKTKVKVKPGERISRSLDQRCPKNLHILGKSTGDSKNKEKEGTCLFEERVDLSSLVIPLESAGEEPTSKPRSESISSYKFDDEVSDAQTGEETMPDKDMCEPITTEADDVLWGDEDHLLLGYIWHEDDMAAVDFEGLEDFQSFEGQEALMFMFEDDDEDEVVSNEESEGDVLPESRDEADISPGEYLADESEGEGDNHRSRTLPAAKGSDNTFVAAFKNGLRKASKYFGPKSDARVKKVSGGGRDSSQDVLSPTPPAPTGMEDDTTAGVYNVQSGLVGGPASHHAPFSDSESADIYSCSSGEYYAAPAMCVNTSDEDRSLALTKVSTSQKEAPSQPPVPPRRWSNRKSRMVQEVDMSPRGHTGAVQQPIAVPPITSLPASPAPHAGIPRSEHHTNGSKEMSPSPAVAPQHMSRTVGSPVWEGYCPPAAPFPGTHMLPHQPCVPAVPWGVDPFARVPEAAHHQHQHAIPNHRLVHTSPTHPVHPYVAPDAVLPYPCEAHHAAYSHPCAGHLTASHASPMAPHIASHTHKPTSVKQLKRKQQERILRQEAEEGLEAAGCAFCVGMPQARQQPPQHAVHWRQSSPHPHASSDRRSWPPRK